MTDRIGKLQAKLHENEGALITGAADRLYLTGFSSSAGVVFITAKTALLIIDFRYFEKAEKEVYGLKVLLMEDIKKQLCDVISAENITRIFVRTECMSMSEFCSYNNMLSNKLSDSRVLDDIINELRSVKSAQEIENIKCAQAITEKTFDYILGRISAGRSEREIMIWSFLCASLKVRGSRLSLLSYQDKIHHFLMVCPQIKRCAQATL